MNEVYLKPYVQYSDDEWIAALVRKQKEVWGRFTEKDRTRAYLRAAERIEQAQNDSR